MYVYVYRLLSPCDFLSFAVDTISPRDEHHHQPLAHAETILSTQKNIQIPHEFLDFLDLKKLNKLY